MEVCSPDEDPEVPSVDFQNFNFKRCAVNVLNIRNVEENVTPAIENNTPLSSISTLETQVLTTLSYIVYIQFFSVVCVILSRLDDDS